MIKSISEPSEKQKLFLTDGHKYVAYGGARGGGKSWAVRAKAKILAGAYPGIKMLIVRKTYQELINNHIDTLKTECAGIAKYNKTEKVLTFINGSTIKFGYCATDSDTEQYQGAEYDVIFVDEATNLDEDWLKKITACMRGVNNFPKRTYYTCNPGGRSHHYIKRLFVDRKFVKGEDPEEYSFIQALVQDNPALMKANPDYIRQLEAQPPKRRAAWLEGKWDIFSGQFFEEFVDDPEHYDDGLWTHVINPLSEAKIRKMNIFRSYDFGFAKPFSCAWWGVDSDGIIYRLKEFYGCTEVPNEGIKWNPDQQFAEIKRIENEDPWLKGRQIYGVADPAIWDASTGTSTAETAEKYGIYFEPGDNSRINGWMQVRYRLQFNDEGRPRMYIFKGCEAFIRTIPLLQFSERRPEDLDTEMEDHVADETRYFCMSRPITPYVSKTPQSIELTVDPLSMSEKKIVHRFKL